MDSSSPWKFEIEKRLNPNYITKQRALFLLLTVKYAHVPCSSTCGNSMYVVTLNFMRGAGTHLLQACSHCCQAVHCP